MGCYKSRRAVQKSIKISPEQRSNNYSNLLIDQGKYDEAINI